MPILCTNCGAYSFYEVFLLRDGKDFQKIVKTAQYLELRKRLIRFLINGLNKDDFENQTDFGGMKVTTRRTKRGDISIKVSDGEWYVEDILTYEELETVTPDTAAFNVYLRSCTVIAESTAAEHLSYDRQVQACIQSLKSEKKKSKFACIFQNREAGEISIAQMERNGTVTQTVICGESLPEVVERYLEEGYRLEVHCEDGQAGL